MRALRTAALSALLALAACQTTTTKEGVDPKQTNGLVLAEIDRRIAELRYQNKQELLRSMTRLVELSDTAQPKIREGAKSDDWLTRASLAWVMGASHDRRYIPDLRAMLDDKVPGVRLEAASALVELGDSTGFAPLVEGLSDPDIRNRYKCFQVLRGATGQDFGYQHDAAPETRSAAVSRWKGWLEGMRASAL